MSTNVVPLFGPKSQGVEVPKVVDVKNVQNDIGFQIRCADFMTYLELLAKEDGERKTA